MRLSPQIRWRVCPSIRLHEFHIAAHAEQVAGPNRERRFGLSGNVWIVFIFYFRGRSAPSFGGFSSMMRFHHPRHASLSTSFVLGSSFMQMKHLPLHPLYITVTIPGAQSSSPFHHHQYPCPSLSGGVCVHSHEAAEQGAGDNRRWTFLLVFISRWLLDIAGRRCLSFFVRCQSDTF